MVKLQQISVQSNILYSDVDKSASFLSIRRKRASNSLIFVHYTKFDKLALAALGFQGMTQAFNILGYAIGAKPTTIKNYRQEFDPYYPNPYAGRHKRDIRDYCKKIKVAFESLEFEAFTDLVNGFIIDNYRIEKLVSTLEGKDYSEAVAKRLLTGKAAEVYFKTNYLNVADFVGYGLKDTTQAVCGFDFQLMKGDDFYCVEVKGLNTKSGSITLTEKEFLTAEKLRERYCLFVVSNFVDAPMYQYFFNPLSSCLSFKKSEREVIQTTYNTQV